MRKTLGLNLATKVYALTQTQCQLEIVVVLGADLLVHILLFTSKSHHPLMIEQVEQSNAGHKIGNAV